MADEITKSEVGQVTITIIGSVPSKILDIPASLSDVMNQLKKISISLAGFMATPPTPPSNNLFVTSTNETTNFPIHEFKVLQNVFEIKWIKKGFL